MRTVTLRIDDAAWAEIKSAMTARIMVGAAYGILDAAINKIVAAMDKGEELVDLRLKNPQRSNSELRREEVERNLG